jgi:hypothetical protein
MSACPPHLVNADTHDRDHYVCERCGVTLAVSAVPPLLTPIVPSRSWWKRLLRIPRTWVEW